LKNKKPLKLEGNQEKTDKVIKEIELLKQILEKEFKHSR
jgi:hypothetical protein